MAEHIKIKKASGTWVVRAADAVLGESANALEVSEGSYDPIIYFPRSDIAMAFLEPSETSTHCPHKGDARYYSIITSNGAIRDAAWSYEAPKADVEDIDGYLAFYPDKATVEQL